MKIISAILALCAQAKPLIHPETGLAITTTGQHWYGQEPLAMAQLYDDVKNATAAALVHKEQE
jgi:hypothetical protein